MNVELVDHNREEEIHTQDASSTENLQASVDEQQQESSVETIDHNREEEIHTQDTSNTENLQTAADEQQQEPNVEIIDHNKEEEIHNQDASSIENLQAAADEQQQEPNVEIIDHNKEEIHNQDASGTENLQTAVDEQQQEPNIETIDHNRGEEIHTQDTSSIENLQTAADGQQEELNIETTDHNKDAIHAQDISSTENLPTDTQKQEQNAEDVNYNKEILSENPENIQTVEQPQESDVDYKNESSPALYNTGSGTAELSDAIAKAKAIAAKLLDNASSATTGGENIVTAQGDTQINSMNNMDIDSNKPQQGIKRSYEDTYVSHGSKDSHDDYNDGYRGDSYKDKEKRYDEYGRDPKRTAYDVGPHAEYDGGASGHRYDLGNEERRPHSGSHYGPGNDAHPSLTEEFKVPNAVVGLVIGRGGENLKKIEKTTGARIQFSQDQPPDVIERHVKVTGLADDVKIARGMIQKLVEDARNGNLVNRRDHSMNGQNKNTVIIHIPSNKVGVVIGRKGETIRDLQDRSGAHINVTPDSAASPQSKDRPVTLIGDDAAIQRAKALINEIVSNGEISSEKNRHKDHRPSGHGSGSSSYSHGGGYGHYSSSSGQYGGVGSDALSKSHQESITIKVPNDSVGLIIGKGGETVRALQQKSGAKIQIEPVHGGIPPVERNVQIIGSVENIAIAKSLILEKAASGNRERSSRHGGEQGRNGSQQNKHQKSNYQQSSYQPGGQQQGNYQQNNSAIVSTAGSGTSPYQQTGYSTHVNPTQSQQSTYGQGITNDYTQASSTNYPVASTSAYVTPGQQATMIYNQQGQYNPSQATAPYQYSTQPQYGGYSQNLQYAQSTTGQSTPQTAGQISMQAITQPVTQSAGQLQVNYYQTQTTPIDPTKVVTAGADNKTDTTATPTPNYGYQQYPYNYNVSSTTTAAIQYPNVSGQTHTAISNVYPTMGTSAVTPYGNTAANATTSSTNTTASATTDQVTQQQTTLYTGYYGQHYSQDQYSQQQQQQQQQQPQQYYQQYYQQQQQQQQQQQPYIYPSSTTTTSHHGETSKQ